MREYVGALACAWFILHGSCLGRFAVEMNYLTVTSPPTLKDVYECAIGNSEVPRYGGTMVGYVLCPKSNQNACKRFEEADISLNNKPGGIPVFLLVDRGDCCFTLKHGMLRMQEQQLFVVVDDRVEPLMTMDN